MLPEPSPDACGYEGVLIKYLYKPLLIRLFLVKNPLMKGAFSNNTLTLTKQDTGTISIDGEIIQSIDSTALGNRVTLSINGKSTAFSVNIAPGYNVFIKFPISSEVAIDTVASTGGAERGYLTEPSFSSASNSGTLNESASNPINWSANFSAIHTPSENDEVVLDASRYPCAGRGISPDKIIEYFMDNAEVSSSYYNELNFTMNVCVIYMSNVTPNSELYSSEFRGYYVRNKTVNGSVKFSSDGIQSYRNTYSGSNPERPLALWHYPNTDPSVVTPLSWAVIQFGLRM